MPRSRNGRLLHQPVGWVRIIKELHGAVVRDDGFIEQLGPIGNVGSTKVQPTPPPGALSREWPPAADDTIAAEATVITANPP